MNVFTNFGLPHSIRLVILCCGMLFGAASVQAQTSPDLSPFVSGNWLSTPDAISALSYEIDGIDQFLQTSLPNAVPFKMKHELYSGILVSIQDGMSVSEAAQMHFYKLAPSSHTDVAPTPDMNNANWQVILNDMIALLTI